MDNNQFAVYQLKQIPETRPIRFRSYQVLQENEIPIQYENYEQVYLDRMQPKDTPERIKERLCRKRPRTFRGHAISVSDILVLNQEGLVTSYYVETDCFVVIADFIQSEPSTPPLSFDRAGYSIEGKKGSWYAFDSIKIEGKEFFLMEHETYGRDAAWVVLDEKGKLVVDRVTNGFDQMVQQKIREYLNLSQPAEEPVKQESSFVENSQKYIENDRDYRNFNIEKKQNCNQTDREYPTMAFKKEKRKGSVLAKLHQKQAEIAKHNR